MYPENKQNYNQIGWNDKKIAPEIPSKKIPILQVGKT